MVRREDDLQFVEDDVDTVSDNDVSSGSVTRNSTNLEGNIYYEIPTKESKVEFLGIPKFLHSRSNSSPSNSSAQTSPMLERKLSARKKSNHDYEKLSVNSNSSKRSTVERITGSFRRRDATHEKKTELKGEEEEHVLETLRQVVRKCTIIDPVKRPTSNDICEMLLSISDEMQWFRQKCSRLKRIEKLKIEKRELN
ncbi:uncharacterized protein CDAR_609121 [Caerostris darwini]|uniref:Uncharacterized protein n=1 Tax=Caerostris darwini TaxID=1538125 RepID=A0AAV4T519_9ARAC|nr:uncharacterized protein CDAR_609121 [Caerostris darwini]